MNKPAIIIQMEGGIVQQVLTNLLEADRPDIVIVDYDTEGAENEETTKVFGNEAFVFEPYVESISDEEASKFVNAVQA